MALVRWSADATRDLDALDLSVANRIVEKVNWFADNCDLLIPEPLHNVFSGLYKLRVGEHRVIYALRGGIIFVEAVKHRREAYR